MNRAKRLECGSLLPLWMVEVCPKAAASRAHSRRFAKFVWLRWPPLEAARELGLSKGWAVA
jgi:hypothetical protein